MNTKTRATILSAAAALTLTAANVQAGTIYVTADADGTGDGSSWASPLALTAALSAAQTGTTVYLKDGEYVLTAAITLNTAATLRGESRNGVRIVGDASGTTGSIGGLSSTLASGTLTVESLTFSNCWNYSVSFNGKANYVLRDCTFFGALGNSSLHSVYLQGGGNVTMENCLVTDTMMVTGNGGQGHALCAGSLAMLTISGCTFSRNFPPDTTQAGSVIWAPRDQDCQGIFINFCNYLVTDTEFVDNAFCPHNKTYGFMNVSSSKSDSAVFRNCTFAGLRWVKGNASINSSARGGFLTIYGGNPVTIENCTFADNETTYGHACIEAENSARLTLRNCAFWNNGGTYGQLEANGGNAVAATGGATYISLISCALPSLDDMSYYATDGAAHFTLENCFACADPLFADSTARDYHLKSKTGRWTGSEWVADSVHSPLIDGGAAADAVGDEPEPNGGVINVGRWGGTALASKSLVGVPAISDDGLETGFDYTKARASMSLAAAPAGIGLVYFVYGTAAGETGSTNGWGNVVSIGSLRSGEDFAYTTPYLETSTDYFYEWICTNAYGHTATAVGTFRTSAQLPPNWGKGGGADVIHVDASATGTGDGSSWIDAVTTLEGACGLLSGTRTNIWIAGDIARSTVDAISVGPLPVRLVGGFTGMENTEGERSAGAKSVIDGLDAAKNFSFSVASDGWTALEDVVFRRFTNPVSKGGNGSLALRRCEFRDITAGNNALGLSAQSGNLALEGCLFSNIWVNTSWGAQGLALNVNSATKLTVRDTSFIDVCPDTPESIWATRDKTGTVAVINNCPNAEFENVAMTGSRRLCKSGSGLFLLSNNCGGTVFRNCLFADNHMVDNAGVWSGTEAYFGAVIHISASTDDKTVDFVNCTFADNSTTTSGGAVYVTHGTVGFRNCIFWDNEAGLRAGYDGKGADIYLASTYSGSSVSATYCDFGSLSSEEWLYEETQDDASPRLVAGAGCISVDPLFVGNGDYHLKSKSGRWDGVNWVCDRSQSRAIDAGAPEDDYSTEPEPNGKRVNLGCYGNTPWASCSVAHGTVIMLR